MSGYICGRGAGSPSRFARWGTRSCCLSPRQCWSHSSTLGSAEAPLLVRLVSSILDPARADKV